MRSATLRLGAGVLARAITIWVAMVALMPPSTAGRFVSVFCSASAPMNSPVARKNRML
jgi:hypothetical protein